MRRVDLSSLPQLVELDRVLRHASTLTEPAELVATFGRWVARRTERDYFISVSRRGLADGQYKITRAIPGDPARRPGQATPATVDPWRDWELLPVLEGGLIGAILAADEPQIIYDLDLTTDRVLAEVMGQDAARMKSLAAVPTYDRGRSLNWGLSFSVRPEWQSVDKFVEGLLDINMMGTATRNLVALKQVEQLNARLNRQLEQIASIQRALLPERLPAIPHAALATSYLTSDESGGDYYDFFELADGRWGILIADVAGHGAAAATVMAMLRAILHAYEGGDPSPAAIMRFCNSKLGAARLDGSFTTAFYAVFDPRNGALEWTRCGHNPPRLRRADGSVEPLDGAGSLPLGIEDETEFTVARARMHPGDTLVLYTDGITEACSPPTVGGSRQEFGVARLDDALARCSGEPACVVDSVHAALFAHTRVMERADDQTLVALRYQGPHA